MNDWTALTCIIVAIALSVCSCTAITNRDDDNLEKVYIQAGYHKAYDHGTFIWVK